MKKNKLKIKTKTKLKQVAKKITKKKVLAHAKPQAKTKKIAKSKTKVIAKTRAQGKKASLPGKKALQLASKPGLTKRSLRSSTTMFGPANVKPYHPKQNEEYMNSKQLEHFRKVLLGWRSQLMSEVDRTMRHMQEEVANYPDPVDRASQEEEFSLELRARDRERKLLRKIDETLNRINDNDYGYCDDCGAEIGIRRLEARPTATQCIECKTIAEIREKQIGEGNIFE